MQPRGRMGFPGLGQPTRDDAATEVSDDARETHTNAFGAELPWATGAITIGDQKFADVGIRYKGNGTIMDASRSIKKSIKVDLDRNGGMEKFQGLKTINLHCGVTDHPPPDSLNPWISSWIQVT